MKKISGIYKITNNHNGKVYIGKSVDIESRWKKHILVLDKNQGVNNHIQNAWNKYGKDSFSFAIVEMINNTENANESLNEKEMQYIKLFNSNDRRYGYNKTSGGEGGKQSEEANKKRSITLKNYFLEHPKEVRSNRHTGSHNPFFNKNHSKESKLKMRNAKLGKKLTEEHKINISKKISENHPFKGKIHSAESKVKMSIQKKGRILSNQTKEKISIANKGRKHTNEAKEKISVSHKGKILSDETKNKISNSKKIQIPYETIEEIKVRFEKGESVRKISVDYDYSRSLIQRRLNEIYKS